MIKNQNQRSADESEINSARQAARLERTNIENIKTTTAFSFAENEIQTELKVISAECVFGMNIFRDFFAGLTDFFGGRSEASQKILRDARETCLYELKREAYELGADGIIGIDLDYQEISGKGKGMLFLVASGTAVKFKD
ncbi:MAG: YbjQ family protein [Proteobacteria bacterium]|nr:YbjQ family protein [Pseudomonadota bacterium]